MTFPLALEAGPLVPADLERYATLFTKTVFDYLPCNGVHLLPGDGTDQSLDLPVTWHSGLEEVRASRQPVIRPDDSLIFVPIWWGESLAGMAVLEGGEKELYAASPSWLAEQGYLISREFQNIKQSCLDPATGLLNGYHLKNEIALFVQENARRRDEVQPTTLALLEVYPRSRDADRSLEYIVRAGTYLDSLLGNSLNLHHLGAGIFALLWYGVRSDEGLQLGDNLLRRLKREDFASAHLGITSVVPADPDESAVVEQIIDQAWRALGVARKRGPFGLCAHETAEDKAQHPLRKPSASILKKLRALWRGRDVFSLVLLRLDQEPASSHFVKRVRALLGESPPYFLANQREIFVFLADKSAKETLAWCKRFRQKMRDLGGGTFSVGIAAYPYHDFKKSEMALNCRKAIRHTEFFGPDTMTVFDAVSLNISGDIYYNQGDLLKAMREYRRGLKIDPANVNLLNSLGVACVQLNRNKMAQNYFEAVLEHDEKNFMALSNLGFLHQNCGRIDAARAYLEKAVAVDGQHPDLLQHLGALYCKVGSYEKAVQVLARCEKLIAKESGASGFVKGARALGVAYDALGENTKAMVYLQRAVASNPRDAGALSRLGSVYAATGQGDDIALSFCERAVDLDPAKASHWFRLAQVQWGIKDYEGVVTSLKESLRRDRRYVAAVYLLARAYMELGRFGLARRQFERVLRNAPEHVGAQSGLAALGKT